MTPRYLALLLPLLALTACSGVDVAETPRIPRELEPELASNEMPRNPQDDFWTEILSDYIPPKELHEYWVSRSDERFKTFGIKWLEFSLRNDLLERNRDDLSPEDVTRVCKARGYDAGYESLREILGRDPE